jgi:lipopolysaccharide transport system ATP-binding protein
MITVNHLTKIFRLYRKPSDRVRELVRGGKYHHDFTALADVSFSLKPKEIVGVIGENGAGKSTLLKIMSGVLLPDGGEVLTSERVVGLLELGSGFHMEMTGLENIKMNGFLVGLSRADVRAQLPQIRAFAELGAFIDEPLKTYSAGMLMRLAFAMAIHAPAKVLLIDEVFSVGDAYFQQKCIRALKDFRDKGGALMLVSHDLNAIKVLCNRALLLHQGKIKDAGEPERVANTYNFYLSQKCVEASLQKEKQERPAAYGDFKVSIEGVVLSDAQGRPAVTFISGSQFVLKMLLVARESLEDVVVGFLIRDRFGQDIFGTNSYHLGQPMRVERGKRYAIDFYIPELNIGSGIYTVTVAAHKKEAHTHGCYYWKDTVKHFEVTREQGSYYDGLVRLDPRLNIQEDAGAREPSQKI